MTKKAVLGRGLAALIEGSGPVNNSNEERRASYQPAEGITEIMLSDITTNPFQPRTRFDEELLEELSESIKRLGLIQPITLRETDNGKYQIISGERRFRAAKMAGLESVPAYIRKTDDQGMLEMALVENIQREDLDAIEVALSYQRLIDECNLTQERLSERVGKKRATITNYLRLLKLSPVVQLGIRNKLLSMGHARALVSIDDFNQQERIAVQIDREGLSVRQVEELVKKMGEPKTPKSTQQSVGAELPEKYTRLVELLEVYFTPQISIRKSENGEGKITITFNSDEDIDRFIENLNK